MHDNLKLILQKLKVSFSLFTSRTFLSVTLPPPRPPPPPPSHSAYPASCVLQFHTIAIAGSLNIPRHFFQYKTKSVQGMVLFNLQGYHSHCTVHLFFSTGNLEGEEGDKTTQRRQTPLSSCSKIYD